MQSLFDFITRNIDRSFGALVKSMTSYNTNLVSLLICLSSMALS